VASGSFQQPRMAAGLRTHSSPIRPVREEYSLSPRLRNTVPMVARPMDAAGPRASPDVESWSAGGRVATGPPASVRPYSWRKPQPNAACASSSNCRGIGAAP
jgi:hypothetical protein